MFLYRGSRVFFVFVVLFFSGFQYAVAQEVFGLQRMDENIKITAFNTSTGTVREVAIINPASADNDFGAGSLSFNPQDQTVTVVFTEEAGTAEDPILVSREVLTFSTLSGDLISRIPFPTNTPISRISNFSLPGGADPQTEINASSIANNTAAIETNRQNIANNAAAIQQNSEDIEENAEGIAIAMALDNPDLVSGQSFAMRFGFGTFKGETGFGLTASGLVDNNAFGTGTQVIVNAGVGFGASQGNVSAKGGIQFGW